MIPDPAELFHREFFACPICTASEGEICDPSCYAGGFRSVYWYVDDEVGQRMRERLRRDHIAREAAKLAAERHVAEPEPQRVLEQPRRKRKKRSG